MTTAIVEEASTSSGSNKAFAYSKTAAEPSSPVATTKEATLQRSRTFGLKTTTAKPSFRSPLGGRVPPPSSLDRNDLKRISLRSRAFLLFVSHMSKTCFRTRKVLDIFWTFWMRVCP